MFCKLGCVLLAGVFATNVSAANPPTATPKFYAYLADCQSTPTMVAFNPTGFDPRKPFELNEASITSVKEDLKQLKPAFDGLVFYEYLPNLTQAILVAAQEEGYKSALLGIWNPKSDVEIKGTADLIKQFNDKMALAVVIGNEGLIDNRYTVQDVQAAAKKLKALLPAKVNIPFATSEPVSEYGLADLRNLGDFLAPNIHPAIDMESVPPSEASAWVKKRAHALATISKKPVLIKETGVPNGGKPNFNPDAQKAYWHEYLQGGILDKSANEPWVSYAAAFEAFDMPWKAEKSKMAIEGHWGLLNDKRIPYPAFEEWKRVKSISPQQSKAKYCQ